jgi:DNA segregation ATPase FtsK/SpoIIIE, S-DNA-T family
MNKQLLELQADRIEDVFSMHNIPASVTGGSVTPRWVRFQVLPDEDTDTTRIGLLSEELSAVLDAHCKIHHIVENIFSVDVSRSDPRPVRLLPLYSQLIADTEMPSATAVLGLTEDADNKHPGAPLLIRLPSPDVGHIFVAGASGAGKTTLLKSIILSLAMSNQPDMLQMLVVNLENGQDSQLTILDDLPHLARPVIQDGAEAAEILQRLVWGVQIPHTVVVIDGLESLLAAEGERVVTALSRILQRGRSIGVYIIVATQEPRACALAGGFPVRIAGMPIKDLLGQGDFLAVAEGNVTHFQGAYVSSEEIAQVISKLQADFTTPSWPPPAIRTPRTRILEEIDEIERIA